ncbi:hypothetical protein CC80DRAFT_504430 [Byssothecium circinans]|uniref:Uncharacterized protein n=1 Tax=Byssothecium circinans TaxID=147558 RepID=A0A6A5TVC2_9PLEO|nr:hypothetical protein CC80DRAFT_504430 [Byssothecium circinans]
MGGNSTTVNNTNTIININQSAPNPPTPNFIETMLGWANNLNSGSPFPITGDPAKDLPTLQTAVQQIAAAYFQQKYNYGWNGPNTTPPNYNNGDIFDTPSDFTNVAQNVINVSINTYVTNDLFPSSSKIPHWAIKQVRGDLATWIQNVAKNPVIVGWQIDPYTRYYTDPDGKVNLAVDAQTIWTVVTALDQNGNQQKTLFLEFVGVYYGVKATVDLTPPGHGGDGKNAPLALEEKVKELE